MPILIFFSADTSRSHTQTISLPLQPSYVFLQSTSLNTFASVVLHVFKVIGHPRSKDGIFVNGRRPTILDVTLLGNHVPTPFSSLILFWSLDLIRFSRLRFMIFLATVPARLCQVLLPYPLFPGARIDWVHKFRTSPLSAYLVKSYTGHLSAAKLDSVLSQHSSRRSSKTDLYHSNAPTKVNLPLNIALSRFTSSYSTFYALSGGSHVVATEILCSHLSRLYKCFPGRTSLME